MCFHSHSEITQSSNSTFSIAPSSTLAHKSSFKRASQSSHCGAAYLIRFFAILLLVSISAKIRKCFLQGIVQKNYLTSDYPQLTCHPEHPGVVAHVHLGVDVLLVVLDGEHADEELLCNLRIREAFVA